MPTYYINSASIDNLTVSNMVSGSIIVSAAAASNNVSQLVFSNSNNVSFGLNGGTITATAGGGAASLNVSAGTTSNNVSQLVFSNANGIEFGLDGSTITAGMSYESYYYNLPVFQGSGNTLTLGGSSNLVQPFLMPYNISADYLRVLLSNSWVSTTVASTANTSAFFTFGQTFWANIYSQGTGANSLSLQHIRTVSATMRHGISYSIGAASSNQTVQYSIAYPVTGGTSTFQTAVNPSSNSIAIVTTQLTGFNTNRYMDMPFNNTLNPGNYWVAFQRSSSASTGFASFLTNCVHNNSFYYATQINSNFARMGAASNVSTQNLYRGHGLWSTNTNGGTSVSLALANISTVASHLMVPFQLIAVD